MKKTHDLAVKTGTYTANGVSKARYENVGMVMTGDDGKEMFLLKRTFNPAGVPNPDGRDSVIVSKFDVKPRQTPAAPSGDDFDDDIPFAQVDWRTV